MVFAIIFIPMCLVAIGGIAIYLAYRFALRDYFSNRAVNQTLYKYEIKLTQYQIIEEYNVKKGKLINENENIKLQKYYRKHKPQFFLEMYDYIRKNPDSAKPAE